MIKPIYNCAQQTMYSAAILGWQNYLDNIADFEAFKAKYTQQYGEDAMATVYAAKSLPDDQARTSIPESNRVQLVGLLQTCLEDWQKLKRYITDVFPVAEQKAMLEAAGSKQYKGASNETWDAAQALLTSAEIFIAAYTTQLSDKNNNMPAGFPAAFTANKLAFEKKYEIFLLAQQGSISDTGHKLIANNNMYEALIKMCEDGQVIFSKDPLKKSLFVFETLTSFVSSAGASGLRIVTKEPVTELPIQGVAFTVQPGNVQGITDQDGVLVLTLPQDSYSIIGIKDGYNAFTEEVNVTTGVVSRKNIELTKTA